jgi:uncharacterized protein (TIGR02145 family)
MKHLLFLLSFSLSLLTLAQTPKTISYQGVARNATGQPIPNQPIKIKLSLLETATSTTSLYTETHSLTTTGQGLFAIQIGAGTVLSGAYATLDWSNGPKFVKTEIDPTGGDNFTLSSTNPLNAVPFALFAQSGTPGANGKNALIRTIPEAAGANCANGGVKIEAGLDVDGNGQLSDTEVNTSQTKFICNGSGGSGTGLPSNPPYGTANLYNCDGQFQYTPCLPKVVTNPVTLIYSRAASFSGAVINNGGSDVSNFGFCWGTSPNPTIADSIAWISNPEQSLFSGGDGRLQPGTTYYVRAFATNGAGNGYGEQKSFTTTQPSTNPSTDVDGNSYNTVTIGAQVWMKENLKVSKYRNGDPIPTNLTDTDWQNTTSGAYVIYNNDAANNTTYGKLYNWYTVADNRGLCPTGWHVPSDAEWTTLENFLGGSSVAGGKMKSTGTIQAGTGLWQDPNADASNSSGFTGHPGGLCAENLNFYNIDKNGYWWSSTEGYSSNAWLRGLFDFVGSSVRNLFGDKRGGFSVRCLRD